MKRDYTNMLQIPCDVLYKAPDLSRKIRDYSLSKEGDLVFLFTGNVSYGRWCSLSSLGGVVKKSGIGKLVIYTATPLTKKMKASLSDCEVHPPVSSSKVFELQNDADVLVHVESFGLKDKLEVRYSISTKIMDYISAQRCILAIGPKDIASMEFLSENKLAICINAEKNIPETISNIKRQRTVIMDCVQSIQKYINNTKSAKQSSLKLEEELYGIIENYKTKSNVIR